ncbi:MAG: copper transporter, partial [Actinomycetota bacterium]|nr:copper transporter [Actinomycetota bacterium]
ARALAYAEEFAAAVAPELVADRLRQRQVLVLSTPDADDETVDAVTARVEEAGAQVTTRLAVEAQLLDPAARNLVESLTAQLLPKYPKLEVSTTTPAYERAGALLARTLLTTVDAGVAMDDPARSVLSSFTTAGLLSGSAPSRRASAVVLVTGGGGEGGRGSVAQARAEIVATVLRQLDRSSDGAVLAAPVGAPEPGDPLAAVRASAETAQEVSSVAAVDRAAGQVAVVLALAEQLAGASGHYGVLGADGAVPLVE